MRAVLVVCEGPHDVAFTKRSLRTVGRCSLIEEPIRELPSPFGDSAVGKGLIATRLRKRVFDDLDLQSAAHLPPPSFDVAVRDTANSTMFILIRTNGKDQVDAVQSLLADVHETFDDTLIETFEVSAFAVAFLFDANAIGMTKTMDTFRKRYSSRFGDLSQVDHGRWANTDISPVGCFVFHRGPDEEVGTLEDHMVPMVESEWSDRYAMAREFIHGNRTESDRVSRDEASQLKAVITAVGQFSVPGAGLTQVIGRAGLSDAAFEQSSLSQDLVAFLTATPWP